MEFKKVGVIGAGAWGSALAQILAIADCKVSLFTRTKSHADEINNSHKNKKFLGEQILNKKITAHYDRNELKNADLILLVVPAQASREVLTEIKAQFLINKPIILCAKGLERKTLLRQSEIVKEIAPKAIPFTLSGPSFAKDVAAGLPSALTLAGEEKNEKLLRQIAKTISGPSFRLYISFDIIGVELAGALKNIYALACGAVEGANLGLSARSALISRAYAEMVRFIVAMGGERQTMASLAGIGDLTLSCTSSQSRNYYFGKKLGQGNNKQQILKNSTKLAEGVISAPVAQILAEKYKVEAPLIEAINMLLNDEANINELVTRLMQRSLKKEGE